MNEYTFQVNLTVTVEAYDQGDAEEIITDTFGEGEDGGVVINTSKVKYVTSTNRSL